MKFNEYLLNKEEKQRNIKNDSINELKIKDTIKINKNIPKALTKMEKEEDIYEVTSYEEKKDVNYFDIDFFSSNNTTSMGNQSDNSEKFSKSADILYPKEKEFLDNNLKENKAKFKSNTNFICKDFYCKFDNINNISICEKSNVFNDNDSCSKKYNNSEDNNTLNNCRYIDIDNNVINKTNNCNKESLYKNVNNFQNLFSISFNNNKSFNKNLFINNNNYVNNLPNNNFINSNYHQFHYNKLLNNIFNLNSVNNKNIFFKNYNNITNNLNQKK